MTTTEILIAVNDVMQSYETEVKSATSSMTNIIVKVKNRESAIGELEDAMKKAGLKPTRVVRPGSSFSALEVQESSKSVLRFQFKKPGGGGSGAGAGITKLTESSQAVYAAVAFKKGGHITAADITEESINAARQMFDVDETIPNILNNMTDDWIDSCVKGANKLWDEFSGIKNGIKFHRGSSVVKHIEKQVLRVKRSEGFSFDINKWSPADIYVTTPAYDSNCLEEEKTLRGLNQCMNERINPSSPKMFGVSLKKIEGNAKLSLLNFDKKDAAEKEYKSIESTPDSKDVYIHFKDGTKIQFRGFSGDALSGWQGEVKGSSANQGKVGGGPVNMILKIHDQDEVDIKVAQKIKNKQQKGAVVKKLMEDMKVVFGNNFDTSKITKMQVEMDQIKFDSWLYSKAQSMELGRIIKTINNDNKRNQLCEDIYLYANSKSSISAPYWKLE